MGAFRVLLGALHYAGLCVSTRHAGHGHAENHISGHAMFTEVPRDVTAQRGQDVEMACSFRGAGMPSYSLEIQWWYIRNHMDWTDRQPWKTNEVSPEEELPKDATKISVVKVVGSNISHKLRLSRVKSSDEGTYECRVIDFSDEEGARHHRVLDDTKADSGFERAHGLPQDEGHAREHSRRPSSATQHSHPASNDQRQAGRELRKRDVDSNHSNNDCSDEPSCAL
ncbi:V-set and transmembrane domain-containing protein 2-like protein isoform X2 [Syngnathoides biaculeatus]|uniref:V-set and transmembrane domain-containing protein 2-like protein isoform X2 n=1 Tax=Syngnathoides biaculeatus TaxID=300417 RepID=UPI002ADD64B0|nr:V-set and transmembrane domain-containing protein 2-like protein isoform X2 [Syngnathoides biaculeatus]